MKLLIVTDSFPHLSETFILNHVTSMIDLGHIVNVISIHPSNAKTIQDSYHQYALHQITHLEKALFKKSFYHYISYVKNGLNLLFNYPNTFLKLFIHPEIKSKHSFFSITKHQHLYNNADIIHAHFGPVGKRLIELKEIGIIKKSIPIACSFHGNDIDSAVYYRNFSFYRLFFEKVDLILSNSEYLKQKLIETKCSAAKIKVLKIGVDLKKFIRTANHVEQQIFKIITVARLVELKGIAYAIKAIKVLVDKGVTNIHYDIIGDGELKESLTNLINDLALQGFVSLRGAKMQDELIAYYENANVFILPSIVSSEGRAEAQGLVIQEAQAMELPVIASNVGGIAEGIIPNETGFLVSEKSPEAIAERIEYLMLNPEISIEMGKKGSAFVKQNFDLATKNNELIGLYEELI